MHVPLDFLSLFPIYTSNLAKIKFKYPCAEPSVSVRYRLIIYNFKTTRSDYFDRFTSTTAESISLRVAPALRYITPFVPFPINVYNTPIFPWLHIMFPLLNHPVVNK